MDYNIKLNNNEIDYIITGLTFYIKEVNKSIENTTSLFQSFGCCSSDTLSFKKELREDRLLIENLIKLLDTLEMMNKK